MLTRFKRSINVVFLDPKNSDDLHYEKGKKVDIILSPKMYWVKKMSLPVTSVREVKKLLPSIFEDSLPAGHYSYSAYRSDDEYILFAYEDKKILDLIEDKGISSVDIASVRFAQSEFAYLENAVEINTSESMYVKEGLVILVPSAWLDARESLFLEGMTLSKQTIKLQQFGHIVDTKSLYKIGAVFIAFIMILLVEIFVASSKVDTVLESKDALFGKYNLQATMFQNKSTYEKYSKIHKLQTKLREAMAIFLTLPLKKNQKITLLEYKNKKLHVLISGVKKGSEVSLLSKLNAKKLKFQTSFKENSIKVEVSL